MAAYSAELIQQQLHQDTQSCEALLRLLDEERLALRERNMDELERILLNKSEKLEALEKNAFARSEMARSYSRSGRHEDDKDTWRKIISDLHDSELEQRWLKLKDLLRSCKLENEVNGKLLARNHQIFARLLDIVRGQTAAPSLYTAQGSASSGGASHIVGEA